MSIVSYSNNQKIPETIYLNNNGDKNTEVTFEIYIRFCQ